MFNYEGAFDGLLASISEALDQLAAEQREKLAAETPADQATQALKKELEKARAENAVLNAENDSLRKLRAADHNQIEDLAAQNDALLSKSNETQCILVNGTAFTAGDIARALRDISTLRSELATANRDRDRKTDDIRRLEDQVRSLKYNLSQQEKKAETLLENRDDLLNSNRLMAARISSQEATIESLRGQNAEHDVSSDAQLERLTRRISILEETNRSIAKQRDALMNRIAEQERELKRNADTRRIRTLEGEVGRLNKKLTAAQSQARSYRERAQDLQFKLAAKQPNSDQAIFVNGRYMTVKQIEMLLDEGIKDAQELAKLRSRTPIFTFNGKVMDAEKVRHYYKTAERLLEYGEVVISGIVYQVDNIRRMRRDLIAKTKENEQLNTEIARLHSAIDASIKNPAYMNTPVGTLRVDSTGMRYLSNALTQAYTTIDSITAEIARLNAAVHGKTT